MLKYFHSKLKGLEATKNQLVTDWLDFLKEKYGVSNADAARSSGLKIDRVRNIRRGTVTATKEDLKLLVVAYPELRSLAISEGIDPDPTDELMAKLPAESQEKFLQEIVNQNRLLSELLELQKEKERKEIEKKQEEIDRLNKRIDQLFNLLNTKKND